MCKKHREFRFHDRPAVACAHAGRRAACAHSERDDDGGANRALLIDPETSRLVVDERGASCDIWARTAREMVSRWPCRKQYEHKRTRVGEHASISAREFQGGAHTVGALSKTTLRTRPRMNREPCGRSRGRVSQAFALTTASESNASPPHRAFSMRSCSGSDQQTKLSISDVPKVRRAGWRTHTTRLARGSWHERFLLTGAVPQTVLGGCGDGVIARAACPRRRRRPRKERDDLLVGVTRRLAGLPRRGLQRNARLVARALQTLQVSSI